MTVISVAPRVIIPAETQPTLPNIPSQGPVNKEVPQENISDVIKKLNYQSTVITHEQTKRFIDLSMNLYEILDELSIPAINLTTSVILSLCAIGEKVIVGKGKGSIRFEMCFNQLKYYLSSRGVVLDSCHLTILKGHMETVFNHNKNKLLDVFDDIFQVSKACFQKCQQSGSPIVNNLIK